MASHFLKKLDNSVNEIPPFSSFSDFFRTTFPSNSVCSQAFNSMFFFNSNEERKQENVEIHDPKIETMRKSEKISPSEKIPDSLLENYPKNNEPIEKFPNFLHKKFLSKSVETLSTALFDEEEKSEVDKFPDNYDLPASPSDVKSNDEIFQTDQKQRKKFPNFLKGKFQKFRNAFSRKPKLNQTKTFSQSVPNFLSRIEENFHDHPEIKINSVRKRERNVPQFTRENFNPG